VFIEKDLRRTDWAVNEKIPFVLGNASSEECLKQAHIDTAKGLPLSAPTQKISILCLLPADCVPT